MIVMKFGGTSIGSSKAIKNTSDIIKSKIKQNPIVVLSAVSGITDKLLDNAKAASKGDYNAKEIISVHKNILKELDLDGNLLDSLLDELCEDFSVIKDTGIVSNKMLDKVASYGERMSARILAANLNKQGIKAEAFDAFDVGFVTDDCFVNAEILDESYENIKENLSVKDIIPIVTGFIAKNKRGEITTLGRGGSDYTAAIIGSALDADEIQIWTDVSGIRTADPRIVPETKRIDVISFNEAAELSYFGAKVLHPKTILPAVKKNIPVKVLNTYEPENSGTVIVKKMNNVEIGNIKAITCKKNTRIITITSTRMLNAFGFLERLFKIFARHGVVVDVVSTSEVSVSATINGNPDIDLLLKDLDKCSEVDVKQNKSIICVVGEGLKNHSSSVAARIFSCLDKNGIKMIDMISQGASEINISFVVDDNDADNVIKYLHKEFIK